MPSCMCDPSAFQGSPEVKPECSDYEFVIHAEELRTPIDTIAFHEPPSSAEKNVVHSFLTRPVLDYQLSLREAELWN